MQDALVSLGILFFFAIVGGVVAARFKLPAALGLLLVGALIGPNMFGLVNDLPMIELMAEFGAILLLFVIGIEFDMTKLAKIGFKAIMAGVLIDGINFFFGFQAAMLFGFSTTVAVFIGATIAFSSTVVIVKILEQKNLYKRNEVPLILAILIIEDIIAVFAITMLSGLSNPASGGVILLVEELLTSIVILLLVYMVVQKIARSSVDWLVKNSNDDAIPFVALGLCAGFAYLAHALHLSPTAGAFLAGSIVASLPNAKSFEHSISGYTLMFTSMFFIAVGTYVNFSTIGKYAILIGVLIFATLISRFVSVGLVTKVFANFKGDQAFFSSITMFSVGEFSLLIVKESLKYNLAIDLVTIASAVIFFTAIIMALTVNYSASIYVPWQKIAPKRLGEKLEMLAIYVRSFFDEIDNENSSTRIFKKAVGRSFMHLGLLLLLFILYREVMKRFVLVDQFLGTGAGLALVILQAVSLVLAMVFAGLMGKNIRMSYNTLAIMMANLDSSRNLQKSSFIIRRLSAGFVSLLSAFLIPVAMFIFHLPVWINAFSFLFVVYSLVQVAQAVQSIGNYASMYVPQSRPALENYRLKAR